jgi:hypothetical protein
MSLAPSADSRDAPPEASPGAVTIPAVSTPGDAGPRQGDGPPARSATTAGPRAEQADPTTPMRPVDAITTTDALHWFG